MIVRNCLLLIVSCFFTLNCQAIAETIRLAWDAPKTNTDGSVISDLAGYEVYFGSAPGQYSDTPIDVGNTTNASIDIDKPGTYYVSVIAYDRAVPVNRSKFSNEIRVVVSDTPQPRCGDGNLDNGEQCDDGNTNNGDGCSSTCQRESDSCEENSNSSECTGVSSRVFFDERRFSFNGTSSFYKIPHSPDFLVDNGSVSFWFNANEIQRAQGLFSKDALGRGTGGHLSIYLENGRIRVRLQGVSDQGELSSPSVSANTWYHVVTSFGQKGLKLYLNGVLVAESDYNRGLGETSGGIGNFEPIALGALTTRSSIGSINPLHSFLNGEMLSVAIFGAQLREDQVAKLYGDKPELGNEPECGNGILETGEQCDDGNTLGGDGCSRGCRKESEVCNDENIFDTSRCAVLGTSVLSYPESLVFESKSDYIVVPHEDSFLLNEGSLAFWFRAKDVNQQQGLFSKDSSGRGTGGHLSIYIVDRRLNIRIQGIDAQSLLQSEELLPDSWYHVVFNFSKDGLSLYLNGAIQESQTQVLGLGSASGGRGNFEPIVIGGLSWNTVSGSATPVEKTFLGIIEHLDIYRGALSQREINTLLYMKPTDPVKQGGGNNSDEEG